MMLKIKDAIRDDLTGNLRRTRIVRFIAIAITLKNQLKLSLSDRSWQPEKTEVKNK
jgi:hypothetical protein